MGVLFPLTIEDKRFLFILSMCLIICCRDPVVETSSVIYMVHIIPTKPKEIREDIYGSLKLYKLHDRVFPQRFKLGEILKFPCRAGRICMQICAINIVGHGAFE